MRTCFYFTRTWLTLAFWFVGLTASAQNNRHHDRLQLADEIERSLRTELLDKWYPRNVDSLYGGFLTTFTYDFQPTGEQDKMIVTQGRHVWSTAIAAELYPANDHFKKCAAHGFSFLQNVMWDKINGGFYTLVDRQGNVKDTNQKTAYGNAFGIYASAAWYRVSKDTNALQLAKRCFLWLEKAHDPVYQGYYQNLHFDGTPVKRSATDLSTSTVGYKDQNSSIHLLEAFTELYQVWPDKLLRARLEEMLHLVRDIITNKKGNLVLFLHPDWRPVSFADSTEEVIMRHRYIDHVSFGHDVETAYLMLEASHVLGRHDDKTTLTIAKKMVDQALLNGWDNQRGGFYDAAYYFKSKPGITIINNGKNWWTQAEGLNTLLLMADLFPKDKMDYYSKFLVMWKYIQAYLIDHENGDWYEEGLDTKPERKTSLKGHIWKATYHQLRAMTNCVRRLREK